MTTWRTLPAVKKDRIGVIGFCWGGGQTFRYATNNPKLKAAVVCYGPAPDSASLDRIKAPILGVYGENDARINAALPDGGAADVRQGQALRADSYPGTGHGFLKPGRARLRHRPGGQGVDEDPGLLQGGAREVIPDCCWLRVCQDPLAVRADSVRPRHDAIRTTIDLNLPATGTGPPAAVTIRWRLAGRGRRPDGPRYHLRDPAVAR